MVKAINSGFEAAGVEAPGLRVVESPMDLPGFDAVLDLAVGDAAWALEQWSGAADAWFLDGFSPALNPSMWSPGVLRLVRRRSAPGARLATFTVAGAVRRGLAEQGFVVEKRPGQWQQLMLNEIEIEDEDKPALVAEWISQFFV